MLDLKIGEIRVLKLQTGEEIVTEIINPELHFVEIGKCILVVMQMDENGNPFPVLLPWATTVKGNIHIDLSKIVYAEEPKDNLVLQYKKLFGKIVTPPTGIVMPE